MKWTIVGLFALGIIAAAAVTGMVLSMQTKAQVVTEAAAPQEIVDPEVEVLTAAWDMEPREVIEAGDLIIKTVRQSLMPEGSASDPIQVVGKVLVVPMKEGQVFKPECFASEGSGFHLASALEGGKRAVNVFLSDDMGMENLLYPGCSVDVVTTMSVKDEVDGTEQPVSITLLSGVMVLAVGNHTIVSGEAALDAVAAGRTNRPSVTLLVEPDEAEMLKLAMQEGSVTFTMRNPMDEDYHAPDGTRLAALSPFIAAAQKRARERWVETQRLEREKLQLERERLDRDRQAIVKSTSEIEKEIPYWETVILRGGEPETKTFLDPDSTFEK